MLRAIDIPKLAYQLLRPNYALTSGGMETVNLVSREYIWEWNSAKEGVTDVVTSGVDADGSKVYQPPRLNTLYRFVLSLLFPLSPALESWDRSRRKSYAIAACQYGQAQVLAILNKYYGQYGRISIQVNSAYMLYFYTAGEEEAVPVYMYSSGGANTPTYFYTEGSLSGNSTTVIIPKELADSNDYDDFIADLNAMLLYGIEVKLKTI